MYAEKIKKLDEEMNLLKIQRESIMNEAKQEIIDAVENYAIAANISIKKALQEIFSVLPLPMQEEVSKTYPRYAPCYYDPVVGRLHTLVGGSNWQFQKNLFHSGGSEEALKTFINKDHPNYNNPKWFASKMEVLRRIYNRAGVVLSVRVG